MDYNTALDVAITRLHDEGRYRTFIDIERAKGAFPKAVWTKPDGSKRDILVWCGNDYLGMGQHPVVLDAMHEALDAVGAGSGGTRNISGTTVYHKRLEAELARIAAECDGGTVGACSVLAALGDHGQCAGPHLAEQ